MYVDFGGEGPTPHTQEMERVRENFTPSSSDGDDDEDESSDE